MSLLDRLLPETDLLEVDAVDVAVPPGQAWPLLRHTDLARSPLIHALFELRAIPDRLAGRRPEPLTVRIDDIGKNGEAGFQVLGEVPGHEVVVGAIGKVWRPEIPFVDVRTAEAFRAFDEAGFVKVAWALRATPHGEHGTHVEFEVRVRATDDESRRAFHRYFMLIGPASRFIRRHLLGILAGDLGTPESEENERPLPGDELLPDAATQITHGITIDAPPEAIWPWLVQMGCRRAGWYAIDALDNGGAPSAREIHPELQQIAVGDVLPGTPDTEDGFEVLRIEPGRALILGGLYDVKNGKQLAFGTGRPEAHWQATWAFVLERLDAKTTRLHARARVAFSHSEWLHALWIRPVHHLMQAAQLSNLAARAGGRLGGDTLRDVGEGIVGAAGMLFDLATPFLAGARSHWGLTRELAERALPGDELVPAPRWSWTHGVEIEAPPEDVWPWIAQIGADKGGFYSYQWLENLAGCGIRNAETAHREWEIRPGGEVTLHPRMPKLPVVSLERGRWFVVHGAPEPGAEQSGRPWVSVSWLFHLEELPGNRARFVSRFRSNSSDDWRTRLRFGPYLTEAVGFVMDRRMLLGVKERVERRHAELLAAG